MCAEAVEKRPQPTHAAPGTSIACIRAHGVPASATHSQFFCDLRADFVARQLCNHMAEPSFRQVSSQVIRSHASDEARAQTWFSHFSVIGLPEPGSATAALVDYSLSHRDTCWHLLKWQDRSHAPATAAGRPNFFFELRIADTVRAFSEHCPGFWRSEQLHQACNCGEWVATDVPFFQAVRACIMLRRHVGSHCSVVLFCRSAAHSALRTLLLHDHMRGVRDRCGHGQGHTSCRLCSQRCVASSQRSSMA